MNQNSNRTLLKTGGGIAGLVALLAILVASNVIVGNLRIRTDLTQENLYSLSTGSRNALKNLDREVTVKLFFNRSSTQVPIFLKDYARQVEDLLKEYRALSGGRVIVETYDPKPDSDEEEWAQRYGITGQTVNPFEPPVYLGLVAVAGDMEGTLPVLDPRAEQMLEYNVTRLIYSVCHPKKPVLGVISSLPVLGRSSPRMPFPGAPGANTPPWAAFQELRQNCEIREIEPSAPEIGKDVDALAVVHPKELPESALYAIDQFALRGGRVLVFVDPLSLVDMDSQPQEYPYGMGQQAASDLGPLFKAWGIGYDAGKVLVDPRCITRVRGTGNRIEESPVILSARTGNISRSDALTSQFESMLFPFAGVLSDEAPAGVTFTALVRSSDSAGTADTMTARMGTQAMLAALKPAGTPLAIAARITGKVKTAFPDGAPVEKKDETQDKPPAPTPKEDHLAEGNIAVIVVADVDMLDDRFAVETMNFFGTSASRAINDNISFLVGAAEQLTGSADLIGIRSRGMFNRPFDRVLALEDRARGIWRTKEEALQKQLEEAQSQLSRLQNQKDQSQRFILTEDQQKAIANFRAQESVIKRDLKEVRKSLRSDIERLGVVVKTVNIALMPLLVSIAGVSYGLARRRRR
jgi:ABC-type uncharacterized transport system involved in gliding motility auxiliary subunit